ncbi:MAG: 2-C-methyl-D-erythritol 4-phosphate cytidylyltransferase [Gracilibacteraceae bacterium]|jgi:2-C-methyl-D-erythritol 4-phosphate cytidylyltransferase|nr:2-C-methyl-D-erythritol 4-phosphate cytidylyltransferase [Gracilibacteraceae bacterium]
MGTDLPKTAAIIPAAGRGRRMGGPIGKLFLPLRGVPVIIRTLRVFEACALVDTVIVPVAPEDAEKLRRLAETYDLAKTVITGGGEERRFSVQNALRLLPPSVRRVVVHDGARPLLAEGDLSAFLLAAWDMAAAVAALPVKDTIKVADGEGRVKNTPPRHTLRAAQTPQFFARDLLTAAYAAAGEEAGGTDDASLVERYGGEVRLLPGWEENIKITTGLDLLLAEAILRAREEGAS